MLVLPVPNAAMAGQGHTPDIPQPMPEVAEPMTVWWFLLAAPVCCAWGHTASDRSWLIKSVC